MKKFNKAHLIHILLSLGVMATVSILLSPILLIFTEGRDGSITVWNFVGIAYLLGIICIIGYTRKHYNGGEDE